MKKYPSIFKKYNLQQTNEGYVVIIYLDCDNTEFAKENCAFDNNEDDDLDVNIIKFVRDNFKDIKVTAIKIMVGTLLVGTITFGAPNVVGAASNNIPQTYTVQSGDSLWKISSNYGISIDTIKKLNNLTTDNLNIGQVLKLTENNIVTMTDYEYYVVVSGDTLWKISQKFGITISDIKSLNGMTSDVLYIGQKIKVNEIKTQGILYIVKSGDTLWKIASANNTTIDTIKKTNKLTTDNLNIGQELFIPMADNTNPKEPIKTTPTPVYNWPDITYIVQSGDTASSVAKKFNTTESNILAYNYMTPDEWLNAGDKIAISGYAPRTYTVTPGETTAPSTVGKLVDWTTEGQYILKRGTEFTVVDVYTGTQFKAKMLAGYNHADVEPLTTSDTAIMKGIFGTWDWTPRPVVIFVNGMNIAASLSGMPHDVDLLAGNGVTGHFDLYLKNSSSHSATTSSVYIQQHQNAVNVAAGIK